MDLFWFEAQGLRTRQCQLLWVCYINHTWYIVLNRELVMDLFQLIGDFLHLVAMLMLVMKILNNRSLLGLSYKTQEIYLVVFLTRYVDIFLGWKSLYLFAMKVLFIGLTAYTIYLMKIRSPIRLTYVASEDRFPHYYLYLGSFVMAVIIHKSFNPVDFLWSFSIWLEAVAILPQLAMIARIRQVENITAHYVLFLGFYRIMYIFHWIFHWEGVLFTSFIAGIVQSLLYGDFIYYFMKSNNSDGRPIEFPM